MTNDKPPAIERTFKDIPEQQPLDIEQAALMRDLGYDGGSTWDDLLKSPRVLIVSEAGAGKTHECRAQQRAKWNAGEPAFYLELAVLAQSSVRDMLGPEEEARFDSWLTSQSDVATFFLDSIDELKLTLGSFETALKKLAKALGGQLGRARIVVTSRPIPIDQEIMRATLPIPKLPEPDATSEEFADVAMGNDRTPKETPPDRDWRNVALMPLSDKQMKQMAEHERVTDPDALLAEIRRRNAEEFARRPQDLIELCADWREHKHIRTHRDQVASNISVKLLPRKDNKEATPLSHQDAFEGASRLALAATFTRKLTLRHSAEADRHGPDDEKPLDPAAILPDWPADKRTTLLERSLFGFASYGRVRFHHRSVIEYLAAQRLKYLREQGMPFKALRRMLFTQTLQGATVVRPSMVPVAAWVALDDPMIFSELLKHEPSVLLNHGDPESLTSDQRKQALRAYVGHYGSGGWRGMRVPPIQVTRFAGPDLGTEINELWDAGIENEEVRDLLLDLISTGRNAECADIAHAVTYNTDLPINERLDGLDAMIGLADARLDQLCGSLADEPARWPDRLSRWAVVRLFPKYLSGDQLSKILSRVSESKRAVGEISYTLPRIIERSELTDTVLEDLRRLLTSLIEDGLTWDEQKWPHLSAKRHFLVAPLAAVCVRLFEREVRSDELLRSAVIAFRLTERDAVSRDSRKSLQEIFKDGSSDLRRALFLADDSFAESMLPEPDAFKRYYRVGSHDGTIVPSTDSDAAWLTALLSDGNRSDGERAMVLEALVRMRGETPWEEHLALLRTQVDDLPDLVTKLDDLAKPRKQSSQMEKWEKDDAKRKKQQERRGAKARASWIAFWREIGTNPNSVFADDKSETTSWNLWRAMERSGDDSRNSGWNRRFVERHFGKEVADRIRQAFMKFWRGDNPTLRSERPADEKNTYLTRWQLGLAAIHAEAEDPTWVSKLTVDEARLALRYVPMQLSGFPGWLDELAFSHPQAVDDILGNELTDELSEPPTRYSSTLQNVRSASPELAALFVPRLQSWLAAAPWRNEPHDEQAAYQDRLNRVLSILTRQEDSTVTAAVRALAESELSASPNGPLSRVWLPTLMRLDPQAGVDAFAELLEPLEPEKFGEGVSWFSSLFGRHHHDAGVPLTTSGFTPELLLRLTRLAYHHVARAQDMERREGSYTPNTRDDAEHARDAVLGALLATEGQAGWDAKLAMAEDPVFAHFKDRIAAIARQRAAEEADAVAFSDDQVLALEKYRELAPATRNDMFALMTDRLDDLDDLLKQDESPRAAWALIEDEAIMRQNIALQLRQSANGRYKINQEAVTADGKETDIRMASVVSDQEAVIELKVGEKQRSGAELRAGIKDQLVTKYMAPEGRRAGCFMVTSKGNRTWEHPDTGAKLDLAGMIAMLNEECARLEVQMAGAIRLTARGLYLSPRIPTEGKKK
ncbi:MAG: hypothetical protein LKF80_05555 [Brevundimonas sp.]|jgi:hypothetical protein|uniref:NACHT domain-containing protein n=1 Tax=Brevundimonas sp. TaxID=1871086 RepID=UPI0025BBC35B|nr:hypothetical protein [Brevundimonas sp.]MCH4267850.1 hypothetical protein [Brevundimonas sp.]